MTRRLVTSDRLCAVSDIGRRRATNEDDFFISPDGRLWIVADGMGGQAAGELASALAISAIVESMSRAAGASALTASRLLGAFALAQDRVLAFGREHEECEGMGTAALAAWIDGDLAHVCHAGDVRCYICSGGRLEQITRDHSLIKGWLEQAIGIQGRFSPEITHRRLQAGDRVLVCSDGLWDALSDDQIHRRLSGGTPICELAAALVEDANAAGGHDNVTVVAYEHA